MIASTSCLHSICLTYCSLRSSPQTNSTSPSDLMWGISAKSWSSPSAWKLTPCNNTTSSVRDEQCILKLSVSLEADNLQLNSCTKLHLYIHLVANEKNIYKLKGKELAKQWKQVQKKRIKENKWMNRSTSHLISDICSANHCTHFSFAYLFAHPKRTLFYRLAHSLYGEQHHLIHQAIHITNLNQSCCPLLLLFFFFFP